MHPAAAPLSHPSGAIVADLVHALDQRGDVAKAAEIGIESEAMFQIGRRLKPEVIGFAQAVQELGNAVAIARDLIIESELGTPEGDFVEGILKRLAETTKRGDFDAGRKAVDDALGFSWPDGPSRAWRPARLAQDSARSGRQAGTAAPRSFRRGAKDRGDRGDRDTGGTGGVVTGILGPVQHMSCRGGDRGSPSLAGGRLEMARRMADTARDSDERGAALVLLGYALRMLGERESGTARFGDAVAAYREALQENTRARVRPMGRDPDEPRRCAQSRRRPGERHGAAGGAVAAYREKLWGERQSFWHYCRRTKSDGATP